MCKKHVLLFLLVGLTICSLHAEDKRKKIDTKHKGFVVFTPEPDALPSPPPRQQKISDVSEARRFAMHTVSQIYGIDVSHYQGQINWEMVRTDPNVRFAYLKATESTSLVDKTYQHNLIEAKRNGIPVGSYHFFSPSTGSMAQLQNFLSVVDPRTQDLVPLIDVEHRGRSSLRDFHARLHAFLKEVETAFGKKPLIYTGMNFYNKYLAGKFTEYNFMLAKYNSDVQPEVVDDIPIVLWQFTSTGSVNGIRGDVDRSVFLDSYNMEHILLR